MKIFILALVILAVYSQDQQQPQFDENGDPICITYLYNDDGSVADNKFNTRYRDSEFFYYPSTCFVGESGEPCWESKTGKCRNACVPGSPPPPQKRGLWSTTDIHTTGLHTTGVGHVSAHVGHSPVSHHYGSAVYDGARYAHNGGYYPYGHTNYAYPRQSYGLTDYNHDGIPDQWERRVW